MSYKLGEPLELKKAILWQYENAPILKAMIEYMEGIYETNVRLFYGQWWFDVLNVWTANRFGLSIWARILGVSIGATQQDATGKVSWGFSEHRKNFNNGNFAAGGELPQFSLEMQRFIIIMRIIQLTTYPSAVLINERLRDLSEQMSFGKIWVVDNLDMTMTYWLDREPSSELRLILDTMDILPRPSAVGINWDVVEPVVFGFATNDENFDNGSFAQ